MLELAVQRERPLLRGVDERRAITRRPQSIWPECRRLCAHRRLQALTRLAPRVPKMMSRMNPTGASMAGSASAPTGFSIYRI